MDNIDAIFLGEDTAGGAGIHPQGKYYKMPIEIDGREVIAYITIETQRRYHYSKSNDVAPTLTVVGWYDMDDPVCGEGFRNADYDNYYSQSKEGLNFEHAEEEKATQLNLLDFQVPIPKDYEPDETESEFMQRFNKVKNQIANTIFEMKKKLIIQKRKAKFMERLSEYETEHQEINLDTVLSDLSEEEKEKAKKLHKKMLECIIRGKYSFSDYIEFMNGLTDVVKGKGVFLSHIPEYRLDTTQTFYFPSNKSIAGLAPRSIDFRIDESLKRYRRDILDIENGFSDLHFCNLSKLSEAQAGTYKGLKAEDTEEAFGILTINNRKFVVCTGEEGEVTLIPEFAISDYRIVPTEADSEKDIGSI